MQSCSSTALYILAEGRNSLGAYGACWQRHQSSSSSSLSDRPARKWRLAHICGTAAGKDRRTCQQGPADRRLAVWLGWQGAAGWTSASRDVACELQGSRVKVQWWCAARREGATTSTLWKQTMPQAQQVSAGGGGTGKASSLSSCPSTALAAQSRQTEAAGPCRLSPFPALSLSPQWPSTSSREGCVGSASFQGALRAGMLWLALQ